MTEATRRGLLASTLPLAAAAFTGSGASAAPAPAPSAEPQAPGFYRYRIGEARVTAVTDGANTMPLPERFVLNADRAAVSAALTADFRDGATLTVPFTPLVIETGESGWSSTPATARPPSRRAGAPWGSSTPT